MSVAWLVVLHDVVLHAVMHAVMHTVMWHCMV